MAGAACWPGPVDRVGLTAALSEALGGLRERRAGHDSGRVIRALTVMLADGGDCLSDPRAVRDQGALFGRVASDSTAFRLIEKIAYAGPARRPGSGSRAGARAHLEANRRAGAGHDRSGRNLVDVAFGAGRGGRELQARLRVSSDARLLR